MGETKNGKDDSIHSKIDRLRRIRHEIDEDELFSLSDDLSVVTDFKQLCLDLAEEAIERELHAAAIAERIKELSNRKSRMLRTAETLRDLVLQCMETKGETSIQSPALTLNVSKLRPDVVITDESALPSRFFTPQPPKLDKALLKDAIVNDGEIIEGATVGNGKITLTIRRK